MHDSLVRGTAVTAAEVIPNGWIAITGGRIVAATLLRGWVAWDGGTVLARPGTGRFVAWGAR